MRRKKLNPIIGYYLMTPDVIFNENFSKIINENSRLLQSFISEVEEEISSISNKFFDMPNISSIWCIGDNETIYNKFQELLQTEEEASVELTSDDTYYCNIAWVSCEGDEFFLNVNEHNLSLANKACGLNISPEDIFTIYDKYSANVERNLIKES